MAPSAAADLARYAIRPLTPGPLDVMRAHAERLGGPDALQSLGRAGTLEAFAVSGLGLDQIRALERILSGLGGTTVTSPKGDEALLMGSLIAISELAQRLHTWGRATEPLGLALQQALLGKGAPPQSVQAGGHLLSFGERTLVMGILDVSARPRDAVKRGLKMVDEGAAIIDVGGEKSGPAAAPGALPADQQLALDVVEALVRQTSVPIAITTPHVSTAQQALQRGAVLVNDVLGLRDLRLAASVAEHGAAAIAIHRPDGRSVDLMASICLDLRSSLMRLEEASLPQASLLVDPGIGFGQSPAYSLEVTRRLGELRGLGRPIVVDPSRASIAGLNGDELPLDEGVERTLALAVLASQWGAHVIRVNDVRACVRALAVADAVTRATVPTVAPSLVVS